ncbi:MAG: N-6 DNA methylase [Gemmatimonadaceae bacterium]|nr:N-6 DNA methylase [Gemmatimonadaceae bacterium]
MLTITDAAALLQRTSDRRGRIALLRTLGFHAPAGELDSDTARRLGLDDALRRVEVAAGPGTLRALLLDVPTSAPLRESAGRAARRVASRAPELLWIVLASQRPGALALVIPTPGGASHASAIVVEPANVRPGDAESFVALEGARGDSDLDTHLRWREALGRDALTRRFYRDLEQAVHALGDGAHGIADSATRRTLALRCTSRLLFLSFLEAKGWLDGDRAFLSRQVATRSNRLHQTLLEPLFFGTLNAPMSHRSSAARAFGRLPFLNGGLFTRDALEKRHRALRFADEDIARVVGELLARYRVTAHERSAEFAEAAVDPEMLGRAFESLMATDDRRNTGAFYTPPTMIRHITDLALDAAITGSAERAALEEARAGRVAGANAAARLRTALGALRILDPACGTGAFLVHAMAEVSRLLAASHDERPEHARRRAVLAQSIFGVDINPTAVWLCELRLWLSVVVDSPERDPLRVPPLPNLDRHIRCADALAGPAFDVTNGRDAGVTRLRERYARATGPRKRSLQHALDRAERTLAVDAVQGRLAAAAEKRRDLVCALRGRDLFGARRVATATERAALGEWRRAARALRRALAAHRAGGAVPGGFASHFGDVAQRGGFDVVVGNPPWVRLHRIPPGERAELRGRFESMRNAAWRAGAATSGALTGFGMQADLAALFTERAASLARPGGVVALLVPAKLFRSLAGGGLRSLLSRSATLLTCEDHSSGRALFEAAVYPAVLVVRRNGAAGHVRDPAEVACAVVRRDVECRWRTPRGRIALEASDGAPWLLLPPPARAAFDALVSHGTPLADTPFGRPLLGVKSGCNDAFVVQPDAAWAARSAVASCTVRSGEREALIERALLRPALRGEDLAPFAKPALQRAIVWTHDAALQPLRALPPRAARWLSHWRPTLARRTDVRSRDQWWSLFRLDASARGWRVAWGDVGRTPRAVVLTPDDDTVPMNSCYVVRAPSEDDADALAAWLNAPLAVAWLGAIAEPARGGYHRFLGWTVARLPLPTDWAAARSVLAAIGRDARNGRAPSPAELHESTLRAFRLHASLVEPLLTWTHW